MDYKKLKDDCVKWIRTFFEENGKGCNAVIGISGGKDSSVTAALCVEALGKDRVIGVLMPDGVQPDISSSNLLVKHLGIKSYTVNIRDAVQGVIKSLPFPLSRQASINLPPRIRMATLYAVSQSHNGRVANTCNLSEDWVGYATRYGDGAGDFSPLSRLTVEEVKGMGKVLGLPEVLVEKAPSDGLTGKTDEDNLGFSYEVLDRYIRTGEIDNLKTREKIDKLHKANLFKLQGIPCFVPSEE
ncbi:MAG: NAD(+) synthase [Sphaerochaetaceae bacterium]|nr:NAD(+) synthase [Sphaerochaetaceae bacterium]